ncbi:hypothetical protein [Hyphomicrobium sp. NDB2Meth4]|uniref:hypothetical protein n=1 Tax=Hyphomicrobium sp. NDB2Meth4 TaxID=1892846 RepID=UPI00092FF4EA|nr:hypothetical protein [Hyphomicrobium sp. NDB2Meth4]
MGTGALRKNLPIAVLGLSAAGLGAAAVTLGNGEAVVERGFQRAIANMDADAGAKRAAPVVAGTEEFWLTHVVHDAGTATAKPVSVGDRITISSNGTQRVLNVVTVDRLDNQVLPVSSTAHPTPLILVTCRDEANPQARPVRFLLEAGEELPALSAVKAARTL